MDPIQAAYERNGILAADAAPNYKAPPPAPTPTSTRPVWEQVLPGDKIRVEVSTKVFDGEYVVKNTDGDLHRGPNRDGVYIEGIGYIENKSVKAIVERDGKRLPGAGPAPADHRPIWEQVQEGDLVEIAGDPDVDDGQYIVEDTDHDLRSGPEAAGISIRGEGYILNRTVKRIVQRNGKPFVVPGAAGPALSRSVRGDFLVHVDVASILSNREKGEHKPVTVVRRLAEVTAPHVARELAWEGPTRFVHHDFMKIEGTDIQNWIETDAPIICWRDDQPLEVMMPKVEQDPVPPMLRPILGAFVVHIAAPVLMKNRAEGRNDPVIAVRAAHSNWADDVFFCRKVEWSGPTRMVHRPTTPIPGTNGRGVAFIETDADLTLYLDNAPPMVLRAPMKIAA